jgi:hypothetical protein
MTETGKTLIVTLLTASYLSVAAQIGMGGWRTHFSYSSVNQLAQSESKIFALSDGALFSMDKRDQSIALYSKITGLNDNAIQNIAYDSATEQLLILYGNGNMDLMGSRGIVNVSDFYLKQSNIPKSVNHILFADRKAYLSADFGILLLNLDKYEIADTYYIGANGAEVKVLNTAVLGAKIYALTPDNLYFADAGNPNLSNYEQWQTMTTMPAGSGDFRKLITFDDKLVLLKGNTLYSKTADGNWTNFGSTVAENVFPVSDKLAVLSTNNETTVIDRNLSSERLDCPDKISDVCFDVKTNLYYFGTQEDGIVQLRQGNGNSPEINKFKPGGPIGNIPYYLTFSGQKLFMLQGGRWDVMYFRPGNVNIYENEKWTAITQKSIEERTGKQALDFMNVAVAPDDPSHFFVTSYGTGLYEFENNSFKARYDHINSNGVLQSLIPEDPDHYTLLDGAVLDREGNLFLANSRVSASIKVLLANGTWTELAYPNAASPTIGNILISSQNQNQKWVISLRYTPGILVFDDNGTVGNRNDDQSKFLSSFTDSDPDHNESISPANYYSMAQDKNGVIWVGTEQGPLLFSNLDNVFEPDYTCSRVKLPRNDGTNNADYLLKNEKIKAIAIDGGNRKWIGTENSGVYLLSDNGLETIRHFTAENSPLLSNNIFSIAINPVTGEVFFGTSNGLISYRSDAMESGDTFGNVHAYPNPVRPAFRGMITITGLIADTRVKITDINGNLIYETTSNGGIATWDGKNRHGNRVATGIYLAICVTEDGSQNAITKIMVIN